jgi:hypothetical protein
VKLSKKVVIMFSHVLYVCTLIFYDSQNQSPETPEQLWCTHLLHLTLPRFASHPTIFWNTSWVAGLNCEYKLMLDNNSWLRSEIINTCMKIIAKQFPHTPRFASHPTIFWNTSGLPQ